MEYGKSVRKVRNTNDYDPKDLWKVLSLEWKTGKLMDGEMSEG